MQMEQVRLLFEIWAQFIKLITPLVSPILTVLCSLFLARWISNQDHKVKPPKR